MIEALKILYVACALFLALYALGYLVLLVEYMIHRRTRRTLPEIKTYPEVAVQLPLYNEKHVVGRLLDAVAALDWPRDKLTVQVLDDSSDDTVEIVAQHVERLRAQGVTIQHVRRPDRVGYKAGALAYGMQFLTADYIALLDADFVPPREFLAQTVPHFFSDPQLGIVQTRWGNLNADDNLLTRAQALTIDTHFVIEQTARNRAGLLLTFNGTGGVWRRAAIEDAGGWSSETLTEDLDLSYRAQLKGWKYLYLPDIVVPGEVPPQIEAYKRQQARWAKGTNQVLMKMLPRLWSRNLSLSQRVMALQHLCQYLPGPAMMIMLLLAPPLLAVDALEKLPLAPLGFVGLVPPIMHVITQMKINPHKWLQQILYFPIVAMLGSAMIFTNTRAAIEAFISRLTGRSGEFIRTPKFGQQWPASGYAIKVNWSVLGEIMLCFYAIYGVHLALKNSPPMAPYMLVYAVSFALVAFWSLRDQWKLAQQVRSLKEKGSWISTEKSV